MVLSDIRGCERDQSADSRGGSNQRNELSVEQLNGIGLSRKESVQELLRDCKGLLGIGVLSGFESLADRVLAALEVLDTLLSDAYHIDINSLVLKFLKSGLSLSDHVGVVTSAQSTVSSDDSKSDFLNFALGQKWKINGFTVQSLNQTTENRLKSLREGTSSKDSVLRTSHLGGSDKLHGHGDLLCVFHRRNTVTNGVGLSVHHNGCSAVAVGTSRSSDIVDTLSNRGNVCRESTRRGKKGRKAEDSHGEKTFQ
mmetsp:Transcript_7435/g.21092  ORF Transcript_7435/g.21092 Transcript_7435/m.21092 type:complete len:254 (+) Transcript_7435:426-1187(+)